MRTFIFTFLLCLIALPSWAVVVNSQLVLERSYTENLDAKSLLVKNDISEEDVTIANSQYDPILSGSIFYEKDQSQRSSTVFGTVTTRTEYLFGVTQLAPTGTQASFNLLTTKETSNSIFATNPKQFDARTYFSITQPVLNNYFGYTTRKNVELAKVNREATNLNVDKDLMDLAYQNLITYWNWYLNRRLQTVSYDALSASIRLYRTNRQKMVIGLIEETDIYAFAANVDLKRSDLYSVQANLASSESDLRVAIKYPTQKLVMGKERLRKPKFPSVSAMIDEAMLTHPEYVATKKTIEAQNISIAMQKNSRLPQLDLSGSLTLNGLDPAFGQAVNNIGNGNPIWTAGVNVSFPLLNRYARANYKKTKLEKTQLLYSLKKIEIRIISQVRGIYKKYQKSYQKMQTLATAVQHQRLKWEGEIKKYDQGRSDPDVVIRYQNDYLDTKKLHVRSQVEYYLARLELEFVRGKIGQ